MAKRSVLIKHDTPGLFSLAGIKYTTAQRFARDTIEGIFGARAKAVDERGPMIGERAQWVEPQAVIGLDDDELRALARDESVTRAEDLVERRMDWIVDEGERARFLARLASILALPSAAIAPSRIENHA